MTNELSEAENLQSASSPAIKTARPSGIDLICRMAVTSVVLHLTLEL